MKWIPDQWIRGEKKQLHPRRVNNQQMKGPVYSCPFLWLRHCPSAVGRVCLPAESKSLITEWGSNVPSEWLYSQGPASGSEVGADSTGAAFRSLRLLLSASLPEKSTLPKWAVITQKAEDGLVLTTQLFLPASLCWTLSVEVNISVSGMAVALNCCVFQTYLASWQNLFSGPKKNPFIFTIRNLLRVFAESMESRIFFYISQKYLREKNPVLLPWSSPPLSLRTPNSWPSGSCGRQVHSLLLP